MLMSCRCCTGNQGQTKTCEVTMELVSDGAVGLKGEASALKNMTSPGGGRDKVKMLFCMRDPST